MNLATCLCNKTKTSVLFMKEYRQTPQNIEKCYPKYTTVFTK